MTQITVQELQEKLPEVLERIERGESVQITREGKNVALLSPPDAEELVMNELYGKIKRRRDSNPPVAWEEAKQWRDEGRK